MRIPFVSAAQRSRPGMSPSGPDLVDGPTARRAPTRCARATSGTGESGHGADQIRRPRSSVSGSAETAFDRSGRNPCSGGHYRGPIYRRFPYSSGIYLDNSHSNPITSHRRRLPVRNRAGLLPRRLRCEERRRRASEPGDPPMSPTPTTGSTASGKTGGGRSEVLGANVSDADRDAR